VCNSLSTKGQVKLINHWIFGLNLHLC
jgi:hypothetical protein